MTSVPRVTVIVPFVDDEQFLPEAVESVLTQTYPAWELLLIDDGSTDGSPDIARRYARRQPGRVQYLQHERRANRGASVSRNLGIRHSRGDYIAFLDADDVWLPHKLAEQVAILDASPQAGMIYGRSQWWLSWEDGVPGQKDFFHELGVAANTVIEPPQLFEPFFIHQTAAVPNPSSVLVRREVIERVGGFVETPRNDMYEDQKFFVRVILTTPVIASDACWDRYRQHSESVCTVGNMEGREVEARLSFLGWLADHLASVGENRFRRGVVREIWSYRHPFLRQGWDRSRRSIGGLRRPLAKLVRAAIPAGLRRRLWSTIYGRDYIPPADLLRWGDLRRLTPLSREFGFDRGHPVDRYYIETFLDQHRGDVRGRVLEIADDNYTRRFGGSAVTHSDILHVAPGDPSATIVADLTDAPDIPADSFDCIILTQTLQVVYDVRAVIRTIHRILKPGGVVLLTAPGISQISRYDMDRWGYYWSFTSLSLRRLFEEVFPEEGVACQPFGNVLTATSFLQGIAMDELTRPELDYADPDYQVIIGVWGQKPESDD